MSEKKEEKPKQSKQRGIDPVVNTMIVDGKEYITCEGAARVLTELAGGDKEYSRFTVYRMLTDYHVDVIRTPSANYYSVQGLRELKDKLHPKVGKKKGSTHYTAEEKEQAMQLRSQGLSNREIGRSLDISYQTINNWAKSQDN